MVRHRLFLRRTSDSGHQCTLRTICAQGRELVYARWYQILDGHGDRLTRHVPLRLHQVPPLPFAHTLLPHRPSRSSRRPVPHPLREPSHHFSPPYSLALQVPSLRRSFRSRLQHLKRFAHGRLPLVARRARVPRRRMDAAAVPRRRRAVGSGLRGEHRARRNTPRHPPEGAGRQGEAAGGAEEAGALRHPVWPALQVPLLPKLLLRVGGVVWFRARRIAAADDLAISSLPRVSYGRDLPAGEHLLALPDAAVVVLRERDRGHASTGDSWPSLVSRKIWRQLSEGEEGGDPICTIGTEFVD